MIHWLELSEITVGAMIHNLLEQGQRGFCKGPDGE